MKTLLQLHDEEQREAEALRRYDKRMRALRRELLVTALELAAAALFTAAVLAGVLAR